MSKLAAFAGGLLALVKDSGMRKLIAMFAALLVVLVLIIWGKNRLPVDLEQSRMIVESSLGFLTWVFGLFVGGNAIEYVAKVIPLLKSAAKPVAEKAKP